MSTQVLNLDEGEVRVVEWSDVQTLSLAGFRLIAIEHHDELKSREKEIVEGQYNSTRYVTIYEVWRTAFYVMKRSTDDTIADLTAGLDEARAALREWQANERAKGDRLSIVEKELATYEQCLKEEKAVRFAAQRESDEARAAKRTLEVDIGKLRTAIGDLRMKEILGGAGK